MKKLFVFAVVFGLACVPLAKAENDNNKKQKKAAKAAKKEEVATAPNKSKSGHQGTKANNRSAHQETARVKGTAKKPEHHAARVENTQTSQQVNRNVHAENQAAKRKVDRAVKRDFRYNSERLSFNDARAHYIRDRHDRGWWDSHYSRVVSYGGGYWYWNSGWWYPAYGYNPSYSRYVYDGPIYGYGYVNPGDMTARVQRSLASRGFYYGPIDGIIGPMTRNAIRQYQIAAGLAVTSVMDEPTLATLGLV